MVDYIKTLEWFCINITIRDVECSKTPGIAYFNSCIYYTINDFHGGEYGVILAPYLDIARPRECNICSCPKRIRYGMQPYNYNY